MTPRTRPTPDASPDLAAALDARVAQDYAAAGLTEDERAEAVTLYVVIQPRGTMVRTRRVDNFGAGSGTLNEWFETGAILPAGVDADHVAHLVRIGHLRAVDVNPRTGEVTTR